MEMFLPRDVQIGLQAARHLSLSKASRLRIEVDGEAHKVLRYWKSGFSLDAATAPHLRGRIDLYDGAAHLFQCLIMAGDEVEGEMCFEFKRATRVQSAAALDFVVSSQTPSGLIADQR